MSEPTKPTLPHQPVPPQPLVTKNLDGTTTEEFEVNAKEGTYQELVTTLFEEHWDQIVFGVCIQGSVFELHFDEKPHVGYLDGYLTIGPKAKGAWHFHLCVGPHKGTKARPTPPELEAIRRCARAAFYRDLDGKCAPASWGLRLWNGKGEQMLTVFFPNPWLNAEEKPVRVPDWSRLELWMALRERFTGVPAETPVHGERPRMH